MPAQTPLLGWPLPSLTDQADGPAAFQSLGSAAEQAVGGRQVTAYTPVWSSAGSIQPSNPSYKSGLYRVSQGWCDFQIFLIFSGATGGGSGALGLSLPVTATTQLPTQMCQAQLWVPSTGVFGGTCRIDGGTTNCWPHFAYRQTSSAMNLWMSTDSSGAAGTGTPNIPASYPIQNGGSIAITGRYVVA